MKNIILWGVVLLVGCGPTQSVPGEKNAEPRREALQKTHAVASMVEQQAGDQLNKIEAETK
ncbi:hypothetical protein [Deefgea sp. CFH1-16]|uniref:hypothetical protein n=1 Tax=Deefgea sp. CFH1-16 TaxID=2675457 RepID=UPI0015F4F795|nr:hypothetical protein [Deefgea sp. CFH1-16]MBM5573102.1 hypothetical protein [Deefgea sp. CFH1-16]